MEIVYGIIGGLVGLILMDFILALLIHRKAFKKRWEPDGIIRYYGLEDFEGLERKKVEIPTSKGTLRGFFYSYPNPTYKGILVFSHGMWGSHRAYVQEIERLAKDGYQVLGFDYFGTELSDGKNIKGLGNSLLSLNLVLKYIEEKYPEQKLFVMGHSWGGFAAGTIAKYHPNLEKIVVMAPFVSVFGVLKRMLPKPLYVTLPFLVLIDSIHCGRYSYRHTSHVLAKTTVDTLLLHSKDDPMISYEKTTQVLQKKIHNPHLSYYIVDGKKHNPDYSDEALAYTQSVLPKVKSIADPQERQEYRKSLDYHKMGEIDQNVFTKIIDFLNSK